MNCLFCRIVNKEIAAKIVYEDEFVLAFNDINPKSRIHVLIIPKEHVEKLLDVGNLTSHLVEKMALTANEIAKNLKIDGYKLQMNVGKAGGQEIFHMHFHLLA